MPPKKKSTKAAESSKASNSSGTLCCVCCQSLNLSKDETLFCDGSCQRWAHRYCLGVSEAAYKVIKEKSYKFRCFACLQIEHQDELAKLRDEVERLSSLLQSSKSTADSPTDRAPDSARPMSYASAAQAGTPEFYSHAQTQKSPMVDSSESRKFNVVIFGIAECRQGAKRHERLAYDLSKVESVFSDIDASLKSSSIKDCFRLGRYKQDQVKSRPILVKLIRIEDVSKVLANRRAVKAPVVVKPDMTRDERVRESTLLKHRWDLINSGIPKQSIKVSKSKIFVNNVEYGCFTKSGFKQTGDKSVTLSSSSVTVNNDNATLLPSNHGPENMSTATSLTSLSAPAVAPLTTAQQSDVSNIQNSHSVPPGESPVSGNTTLTPSSDHSLTSSPE